MSERKIDALAAQLAIPLLAEWIAIDQGETRCQSGNYMDEAEELAGYLYVIGYRLVEKGSDRVLSIQPGIRGEKPE